MDPIMKEWAYAREVMRCLGFLPDEIFFGANSASVVKLDDGTRIETDRPIISLVLRTQNKSFVWSIGTVNLSYNEIQKAYEDLCASWNEGTDWDVEDFHASEAFKVRIPLLDILHSKGFIIPSPH